MEHGIRSTGKFDDRGMFGDLSKPCDGSLIKEVTVDTEVGSQITTICLGCGWRPSKYAMIPTPEELRKLHNGERDVALSARKLSSTQRVQAESSDRSEYDKSRPTHYKGDYAMRVIEDFDLKGAMVLAAKHILRNGRKEGESELDDAKKALWYVRRRVWELQCQEADELGHDKPLWREE